MRDQVGKIGPCWNIGVVDEEERGKESGDGVDVIDVHEICAGKIGRRLEIEIGSVCHPRSHWVWVDIKCIKVAFL